MSKTLWPGVDMLIAKRLKEILAQPELANSILQSNDAAIKGNWPWFGCGFKMDDACNDVLPLLTLDF